VDSCWSPLNSRKIDRFFSFLDSDCIPILNKLIIGKMTCAQCLKSADLCVCSLIHPLPTRTHILILQHPQEPDHEIGSARIAHLALPHSTLKVGLSWPNLSKALGREASPSRWGVLYLGSGVKSQAQQVPGPGLYFVSRQGTPVEAPNHSLEGVVILDGTWSQAKTLWWRNAWLLKLKRLVLKPTRKSLYKELRREPRAECLSTIESIAETLDQLGEPVQTGESLRSLFSELLNKKRARSKAKI
jgi:DTW domain-containing protein